MISSTFGLGKALVDGDVDGDIFEGSPTNWEQQINKKETQWTHNGVSFELETVEPSIQNLPSLTIEQCNQIYSLLEALKKEFKVPQDIEFCYVNDSFSLLQSRDITTSAQALVVWDNSNIVESYPGITSPFTFSFIQGIYATAYKNFAHLLGVSKSQINANNDVFNEMLGHIKGRVYYHLINWYKALSLLPGYKINAAYMEQMMGVEEPLGLNVKANQAGNKMQAVFQLITTFFKLLVINRKLPRMKTEFQQFVSSTIAAFQSKQFHDKPVDEIWSDYLTFKDILVNKWQPPLANDLFAMIYYGALRSFCEKNFNDNQIHNQLLAGKRTVDSAEPAIRIQKIIQSAGDENRLKIIQQNSPSEVWQLSDTDQFGKTGKLIKQYIELFGDRSVGELKLEEITFAEEPWRFIKILSTYTTDSFRRNTSHEEINCLESELKKKLNPLKKWWFGYLVKKAAETIADRENLRLTRTRVFGVVRKMINEIGRKLTLEQAIDKQKDVFFLKEAELNEYIRQGNFNLVNIITNRKSDFKRFELYQSLPNRIHQRGRLSDAQLTSQEPIYEGDLEGMPCWEGVVRGRVRVMNKPDEVRSLEGDILVTQSTDPGWITIFTSAGGILVERGSALSHASIVSRELGIPCIVAVKGITTRLKTGDMIEMDGKTGKIKIIE